MFSFQSAQNAKMNCCEQNSCKSCSIHVVHVCMSLLFIDLMSWGRLFKSNDVVS